MSSEADPEVSSADNSEKWQSAKLFLLAFIPTAFLFILFAQLVNLKLTASAVLLACAAMLLLIIERLLGQTFSNQKYLKVAVIVFLSALFAYHLFGMNLEAEFGLIDDHEIMLFMGTDGKITVSEAPAVLMNNTEVGELGSSLRFRPAYYVLRLSEAILWGNNPSLWYLSRLIMVVVAISLSWTILSSIIGFLPAGLVIGLVFLWPSWGDIFSRLGPAEAYAVVGLAFFSFGCYQLAGQFRQDANHVKSYGGWILVSCGYFLAVGSKENFLILLPVVLLFFAYALKGRRWPKFAAMSTVLMVAFSALIAYAILSTTANSNADIYGQATGLLQRFDAVWDMLFIVVTLLFLIPIIILLALLFWSMLTPTGKWLARSTWTAFAIVVGSYFLLFFSQYFFYAGKWPTKIRYDFPGLLFVPIVAITLLIYGIILLRHFGLRPVMEKGLRAGLIAGAMLLVGAVTYSDVRDLGFRNVDRTQEFARQLHRVTTLMRENPQSALIIESHDVRDYEEIFSWGRYLQHAQGIDNPIFLRTHYGDAADVDGLLNKRLALQLEQASINGERGLSPHSELRDYADHCFSLQLSGYTETNCQDIR